MATTSLSLGEHWETFIRNEIASGGYGSANEVVRDALRSLEDRKQKLEVQKAPEGASPPRSEVIVHLGGLAADRFWHQGQLVPVVTQVAG